MSIKKMDENLNETKIQGANIQCDAVNTVCAVFENQSSSSRGIIVEK